MDDAISENNNSSTKTWEALVVGVDDNKRALLPQTLAFVHDQKFSACSPVQEVCIPAFLGNRDVAVEACTGSGKTLAYLIPIVERLALRLKSKIPLELPPGCDHNILAIGAIVIVPTRELAVQVQSVLDRYLTYFKGTSEGSLMYSMTLFGGRPMKQDKVVVEAKRRALLSVTSEDTHALGVLICTPGRLQNQMSGEGCLLKDRDWTVRTLEVLVLDEADRLFANKALQDQMKSCLSVLPRQRRTGLFSATLTNDLRHLASAGLRSPLFIRLRIETSQNEKSPSGAEVAEEKETGRISDSDVESGGESISTNNEPQDNSNESVSKTRQHAVPSALQNEYVMVEYPEKMAFLLKIFHSQIGKRMIIFMQTCASVNHLYSLLVDGLNKMGDLYFSEDYLWNILRLHGHMSKAKRQSAVRNFVKCQQQEGEEDLSSSKKKKRMDILLCSDLGARGLDFQDVDVVVHYDPPQSAADYIHRSGRTARAGRLGRSILFLMQGQEQFVELMRNKGVSISPLKNMETNILSSKSFPTSTDQINESLIPIPGSFTFKDITVKEICLFKPPTDMEDPSSMDVEIDKEKAECTISLRVGCNNTFHKEAQVLLKLIKVLQCRDRMLYENAKLAFVSFIKSYQESTLEFVLPLKTVELGLVANGLGLCRLPRVKEILGKKIKYFESEQGIDPDTIHFRDEKAQERFDAKKQRKKNEAEANLEKRRAKKPQTPKEKRRMKRKAHETEWYELQKEARLTKKLDQGKIDLDTYERLSAGLEDEFKSQKYSSKRDDDSQDEIDTCSD